ncbi:MAG: hypothetical protein ACOZE5_05545 [Verrucomicrobiota bacterium]
MNAGYGYSLDSEAVAVLLLCSGRERRLLVAAFDQLARYPTVAGDFHYVGPDARECQVFAIGDFVVTCWPDHAVKMVRILSVVRV